MANWYGTSRSNYFRVKEEAAFRQWADNLHLGIFEHDQDHGLFAIHPGDWCDNGSWPSCDLETDEEIDIADQLSKHLAEGQVAVLMTAGAEKLRYITGYAIAVNADGDVVSVSLDDIYAKAAESFKVAESAITQAVY